jgi:hypothetical protein
MPLYRIAVEALILPVDEVATHYKDGYFGVNAVVSAQVQVDNRVGGVV